MRRWLPGIVLLLIVASCASRPVVAPGQISHVVVFWLKKPGDAEGRRRIVEASKSFERIPGVVGVQAGLPVPSTRPVVDSSYDVGVVITFKDERAMHEYEVNPLHKQAVDGVLREVVERIRVYDFRQE